MRLHRIIKGKKRYRFTETDLKGETAHRLDLHTNDLLQVYKSVEDIDLFTGGLCETPLQGGIIGPTFGCVIGLQFSFLRKCDRFW